ARPLAVFRCDASPIIGGGHVTRCLALADALENKGWDVAFVCVNGADAVVAALDGRLALGVDPYIIDDPQPLRDRWPGGCDLLVVDHYKLDSAFEGACRGWARKILVIDDMADRPHDCDLLMDQTYGRQSTAYEGLVSAGCRFLIGTDYALLRPEFATLRDRTMNKRHAGKPHRLMIAPGATDPQNIAGRVLLAMRDVGFDFPVDVVLSRAAPFIDEVRAAAKFMSNVAVHVDTDRMAELMMDADLAIGAPGSTSWERCCLGLPSVLVVVADNQMIIAQGLEEAGAARVVGDGGGVDAMTLMGEVLSLWRDDVALQEMSSAAFSLCDGLGARRVAEACVKVCGE
ncbi:MAG: UDP-2,4-diacetamido-2,4,6-trideoxy-beta-L-altropyranose hydrolase, partial [Rhodospirillales bacterium]|nr:UDP-2,4-diacetamido-2,4,6-trideoxy-beta-L-altropyranose hydrolase [Rhodospirillales bacterium]